MATETRKLPKTVTIEGELYAVEVDEGDGAVVLVQNDDYTNAGDSRISLDDYRYTHGGRIFQAAVRRAKELADES